VWLTFISSIVGHLISWPVAILIVVLLFLRQIRELLPSLRHARFGDNVELDFREEVERLEERAEQAQLPPPVEEEPTLSPIAEAEQQAQEVRWEFEEAQQRLVEAQQQVDQQIEDARPDAKKAHQQAIQQAWEAQQQLEEARRKFEEAEQQLAQQRRVAQQQLEEAQERHRRSMLYSLADAHPPGSVVLAWQEVELEARKLAERMNIFPTRMGRSASNVFSELRREGVIDADVAAIADDLRHLRNRAVHDPEPNISTEDAKEYIEVAARVAEYLRRR
jgi:multidrug efflux pump subunit AcrA (membrane-fusion protein)